MADFPDSIWGVPVVVSEGVPSGTAIVGRMPRVVEVAFPDGTKRLFRESPDDWLRDCVVVTGLADEQPRPAFCAPDTNLRPVQKR